MNTRQQIVDYIATQLDTLDANIYQWTRKNISPAECPAVTIEDRQDTLIDAGIMGQSDHELSLDLVCTLFGNEAPKDARELTNDVLIAITSDTTFGGLIYDVDFNESTLEVDETGKLSATMTINLTISYRTTLYRS